MRRDDRLTLVVLIGLVAVVVVFMWPALVGDGALMTFDSGRWLPWSVTQGPDLEAPSFNADCARFVLPRAELLRRAAAAGELPLWDPDTFMGNPFLALWQTQVLYPPSWLLLGMDARHSLGWTVALHLAIWAMGTLLLLRRLGLSTASGVAGALALVLGGGSALRMSHPSFIATSAWLPWCLLGIESFVRTRRSAWLALLACAWALLILAGQATLVVFSGYLLGAWCAVRVLGADAAPARVQTALALIGALVAGSLLAGPQLAPSLELAARSARAERGVEGLRRRAVPPAQIAQIVAPELYGSVRLPPAERLQPDIGSSERSPSFAAAVAGYAGAWLPAFAVLALLGGAWRGRTPLLAALGVVAIALALGTRLFDFAYAYLPGFRFSAINRALPFAGFALVLLATRGMCLAVAGSLPRARTWGVAAGWVVASISFWVWLRFLHLPAVAAATPTALSPSLGAVDRFAALALVGGALMAAAPVAATRGARARGVWWSALVLALLVELWSFASPYRVVRPRDRVLPATPSLTWLREHGGGRRVVRYLPAGRDDDTFVEASALSVFGLREVGGFAPMHADALNQFLGMLHWPRRSAWSVGAFSNPRIVTSPLFGLLSAPFVLSPPGVEMPGLEKLYEADLAIWRVPHALPEAFVVHDVVAVRGLKEALRRLSRPGFDPRRHATVAAGGGPVPAVGAGAAPDAAARATIRARSFNRIAVEVTADAPGWLVLSEAFAPGWQVRSDGGAPVPAVASDAILLGAPVAAGRHELVFEYRPVSFRIGLGMWLLGALVLTGTLLGTARSARPRPGEIDSPRPGGIDARKPDEIDSTGERPT